MDPISRRRRWPWVVAGTVGFLVVTLAAVIAYVDEPLRRQMEARVNAQLKGYTVSIGGLDLQPLGLALVLEDVTLVQDSQPRPPMAFLPRWRTSVQWRALLSGALVADVEFDGPELYLTQRQGENEMADPTPVEERGWQDAVEAVYPLRINEVRIRDASITYFDAGTLPPIRLRDLDVRASDIRNVRSRPGQFPSPFHVRGLVHDGGRLTVDGHADFLAEPTVAVKAQFDLRELDLTFARPLARHVNVDMRGGVLDIDGRVQVAEGRTLVDIDDLQLARARIDYVHTAATARDEERRVEKVARAATDVEQKPATRVTIEKARLVDSELAYVDRAGDPDYRLYFTGARLDVTGFSNERSERRGTASFRAKFMNSGPTSLDASFAPASAQADFALDLQMRDVDLRTMNDLLQARGGFDVNRGTFSLYSEIDVGQGRIDGYVKPLFADMDVYDHRQDKEKNVFRQVYEGVVGGVGALLQNRPRDEVATVADLSGPIEKPDASTLDVVLGLIRNAFFQAILPGLEREKS